MICRSINSNIINLPVSATLGINEKSNRMIKEGRMVYKLGLGQSPFPVPEPVVRALKENAHQKDYLPVKGLERLRETIAEYYRKSQGVEFDVENIIIGPGSKELMFILQLVFYGELLLPSPSWVSYDPQARILGRSVGWLKTTFEDKWLLQPDVLDDYCNRFPKIPRVIILNYPNNPTGLTYPVELLKELADVARRHNIVIISDEIYGELDHDGDHISIAKFYPEGTIISSGLSKWCGAGGWRLGTFAIPEGLSWLADKMAAVASETFTSVSAPIQYAAIRAFEFDDEIQDYLKNAKRVLKAISDYIYSSFKKTGIEVHKAEGAFYYFVNFENFRNGFEKKGIKNGRDFCNKLLERSGVAVLPGEDFGRDKSEISIRLAYVDFDGELALNQASKIEGELNEDFVRKFCKNTFDAIQKICSFVEENA